MVKIEKLLGGCKATFVRNNVRQPLLLSQLISMSEFNTIELDTGSIIYSIDETEIGELKAKQPEPVVEAVAEPVAPVIKPAAKKVARKTTVK